MPSKKRKEEADQTTGLLQVRVPLQLWRQIETIRHERSLAMGRTVTRQEVVVELLVKALGKP
jgi:hypothetical protein